VTTVLLVRHAHVDAIGVWLAGRSDGVALSAQGREEAHRLACAVADACQLHAIYASPLARAEETAAALARRQSLQVATDPALIEVDFGRWTGRRFSELEGDPRWHAFNQSRATATIPGGEDLYRAQRRALDAIAHAAAAHPGGIVAYVTHAEIVRLALLAYRSWPLDRYASIEIEPASVTTVQVQAGVVRVLDVNARPHLSSSPSSRSVGCARPDVAHGEAAATHVVESSGGGADRSGPGA